MFDASDDAQSYMCCHIQKCLNVKSARKICNMVVQCVQGGVIVRSNSMFRFISWNDLISPNVSMQALLLYYSGCFGWQYGLSNTVTKHCSDSLEFSEKSIYVEISDCDTLAVSQILTVRCDFASGSH